MTPKELAIALNGTEYPFDPIAKISGDAKDAGLVIVYGASDDLMEFRGAIYDEVGAWNGVTVTVDAEGLIPDFQDIIENSHRDEMKDKLRAYFKREGGGKPIEAIWGEDDVSWSYKTEIPHETFHIVEDGEVYCRGIVFSLADLGAPHA